MSSQKLVASTKFFRGGPNPVPPSPLVKPPRPCLQFASFLSPFASRGSVHIFIAVDDKVQYCPPAFSSCCCVSCFLTARSPFSRSFPCSREALVDMDEKGTAGRTESAQCRDHHGRRRRGGKESRKALVFVVHIYIQYSIYMVT